MNTIKQNENEMSNLDDLDRKIISFLLMNDKVHYVELTNYTGVSKVTLSRHLDFLNSQLQRFDIRIIRKKGGGIYLRGNINRLFREFNPGQGKNINRMDALTLILLLSSSPLKIQDIADKLFVSRNTLHNDIKNLKGKLDEDELSLRSSSRGIILQGKEIIKRKKISEILNTYYSNSFDSKDSEDDYGRFFGDRWDNIFDSHTLKKILQIITRLLDKENIEYIDYQVKDLTIHVAIIIQRIETNDRLKKETNDNNSIEKKQKIQSQTDLLVKKIQQEFQITLPETDRNYLNLHVLSIINTSERKTTPLGTRKIKKLVSNLLSNQEQDSILLNELSLHLSSAVSRLKEGLSIRNPYTTDIKNNFPYSFDISVRLSGEIKELLKVDIPEDEIAYIALHFQSFLERRALKMRTDAIIVCNTGLGTSRFLEQRLQEEYRNQINILEVVSVSKFRDMNSYPPLILSTVYLKNIPEDIIVVSPLLSKLDKSRINMALEKILAQKNQSNSLIKLIYRDKIFIENSIKDKDKIISFLGKNLIADNYAKPGLVESAIKREKLSSTALKGVATPHAESRYVTHPCISILINKNGINWNEKKVNVVFFIALNKTVEDEIRVIYKYFSKLIMPDFIREATKCNSSNQVYKLIENYIKGEEDGRE